MMKEKCGCLEKIVLAENGFPLAVPSVHFGPWAGLVSCCPRRQKLLPVSAAGGGRNFSL